MMPAGQHLLPCFDSQTRVFIYWGHSAIYCHWFRMCTASWRMAHYPHRVFSPSRLFSCTFKKLLLAYQGDSLQIVGYVNRSVNSVVTCSLLQLLCWEVELLVHVISYGFLCWWIKHSEPLLTDVGWGHIGKGGKPLECVSVQSLWSTACVGLLGLL